MARRILWQMVFILFGIYCIYHLFNGRNGLLVYWQVKRQLVENQKMLHELDLEKQRLERLTKLLSNKHICKDLLEEQVRKMIHYSYPGDILIVYAS